MSTPAAPQIETVKKSISCPKMSIMYINGTSVCIFGGVSEIDVQRRKGWIERTLRTTENYTTDSIVDSIKMSRFWLNYVSMGTRYPNVIDKKTYREWDKDRTVFNPVDKPKQKKPKKNNNRNRRNNTKRHKH
jgi:hypothetical protein